MSSFWDNLTDVADPTNLWRHPTTAFTPEKNPILAISGHQNDTSWQAALEPIGTSLGIYDKDQAPAQPTPTVPDQTAVDVVAADQRLRRALAAQQGQRSTIVTGGLSNSPVRLTLPTLVGTRMGA